MAVFSRGFGARRRESDPALPPGQYLTEDFPVLSAGPTPHIRDREWVFDIMTEKGSHAAWDWRTFTDLPVETIDTDIHCVTRWSKLGTRWKGVSLDYLLDQVETDYEYVMAHSYGRYTTNLALADLRGGKAWIAYEFDGKPLAPEHGGPARLLVPHLYFWKSAKWITGLRMQQHDDPGFWEQNGYHRHGDPWREQRYW